MSPNLVGVSGSHWGKSFPLQGESIIGREATATIACESDSSTSRRHARVLPHAGSWLIEDLGSSNGTFVNGAKITAPTPLGNGDEIRIGAQVFRFEAAPPVTVPPMASRPREVSRGEKAASHPRGTERIYTGARDLPGCAVPRLDLPDLSGCIRYLMLLLIALVVLALIAGLIMLVSTGIGILGGSGSPPAGGRGGSTTTGGGAAPPDRTDQDGSQEQEGDHSIEILSARISARQTSPRVLVRWKNVGSESVSKIWANVSAFDEQGRLVTKLEEVVIYDGKAVFPNSEHEDSLLKGDGFTLVNGSSAKGVKIEVTRHE